VVRKCEQREVGRVTLEIPGVRHRSIVHEIIPHDSIVLGRLVRDEVIRNVGIDIAGKLCTCKGEAIVDAV